MLIAVLLAVVAGVSRTVGRMLNAGLAAQLGALRSTFANYLVGLLCSLAALCLSWFAGALALPAGAQPPVWAYLGAAVGVLFVMLSNRVSRRLPAFTMTVLLVAGQIVTGLVIDWLAGSPPSPGKLIGAALIIAGLLSDRSEHSLGSPPSRS